MENFKLSKREKVAMQENGMEGTGIQFVPNEEAVENKLRQEQVNKFNNQVDEYVDKFNQIGRAHV